MSTERSFDPKTTYISGGLNDSTGREPFEDPTRDFIPSGTNPAATAGHLHHEHGHHHNEGLNDLSSSTHPTSGNNSGSYNTGSNTGLTGEHSHSSHHTGSNTGLTGDHSHSSHHTGSGLTGAATALTGDRSHNNYEVAPGSHGGTDLTTHGNVDHLKSNTSGDFKAGTARDPAVGEGRHTGSGLSSAGYVGNQTGDSYGGVQTGNTHFGTGENLADKDRSMTDKIKDKVTGNDNKIHAAPGTEGHGSNIYGSSNAAREYENATDRRTGSGLTGSGEAAGYDRSSGGVGNQGVGAFQGSEHGGPISGGAAGTDRFDTSRDHGVTRDTSITGASSTTTGNQYGHDSDNKAANDHKLSGITRHGDDFTKGDTADSAYHNYQPTGLTGREETTTGVHDKNLESTGAHKEGLLDKVKNLIGGHSNTTNADHK